MNSHDLYMQGVIETICEELGKTITFKDTYAKDEFETDFCLLRLLRNSWESYTEELVELRAAEDVLSLLKRLTTRLEETIQWRYQNSSALQAAYENEQKDLLADDTYRL